LNPDSSKFKVFHNDILSNCIFIGNYYIAPNSIEPAKAAALP
jgi:hypothetical protein